MPEIFYEKILNNPDAKVFLTFPINGGPRQTILAYMAQETFTIGGGSQWTDPGMDIYSPGGSAIADEASRLANMVSRYRAQGLSGSSEAGARGGTGAVQGQVRTVQSTIANWTGSDKFKLPLVLDFVAYREDIDVRKQVKDLLTCVYPIIPNDALFWMTAPNKYDTTQDSLISVNIGRWFATPPIFLMDSCTFNFSREVLPNGKPLFARGSVNLVAYRLFGADVINSFFVE